MIEPDYYMLAMAADKTGYSKAHLISLAAEDKLSLYARLGGAEAIEIECLSNDPDDVYVEPYYLSGLCKIPLHTIQQYQNDRFTVLHGFTLLEPKIEGLYYNLNKPRQLKDIALLVKAEDVERLSKKETVKTTVTETERNTMLKLIIGMAMHGYDYDPSSDRNSATGGKNGISAKLATRGISIDSDTIRKYLSQAKDLI